MADCGKVRMGNVLMLLNVSKVTILTFHLDSLKLVRHTVEVISIKS